MVRRDDRTLDLLAWQPPRAQVTFHAPEVTRASTLGGKLCRAMAISAKECGLDRDAIAASMSEYLGESVTKNMLDAYLSEARESHTINVPRFAAFVHATGDRKLLSILPELFGLVVTEARFLAFAEAAQLQEHAKAVDQRIKQLMRSGQSGDGR